LSLNGKARYVAITSVYYVTNQMKIVESTNID